jgi:hypothetical protein
MKTSELRVGNYYYVCSTNQIEIVTGKTLLQIFTGKLSCMKPIPLTEEWLLKFDMELTDGFSSSRKLYLNNYENDISKITYSPKEKLLRLSNGQSKGTMLIPHIKYVHQLQNIYFALTGIELTFKSE